MIDHLFVLAASLQGGTPLGQALHSPPPQTVCPPVSYRVVAGDGSPPYNFDEPLLGFSSEWLVWEETFDAVPGVEWSRVQAYHVPTGARASTGLLSELYPRVMVGESGGRFVFQAVSEFWEGDRNGDGDAFDQVLHTLDLDTGTVANLGLALGFSLRSGRGACLFRVEETSDENGDGDTDDTIVYGGDFASGIVVSSAVASSRDELLIDGNCAAWLVSEEPGQDLNGDGDSVDDVHFVFDFSLGFGVPLGLAEGKNALGGTLAEGLYAFSVDEAKQSADLNADGDQADEVVFVFRFDDGTLIDTGIARQLSTPLIIDSGKVAFVADGTSDAVVVDTVAKTVNDLGIPVSGTLVLRQDRLLFLSPEGATDRNGDGDTLDRIPWFHEFPTGTTGFVPRAATSVEDADDSYLLFNQDEAGEAGTDLNGDGDATDRVWGLYAWDTGSVRNLGLARSGFGSGTLFGDFAALSIQDAVLGHVWVNASTSGPRRSVVGKGPLLLTPLVVEGLGLAGLQYYQNQPPYPPAARFLVFPACP